MKKKQINFAMVECDAQQLCLDIKNNASLAPNAMVLKDIRVLMEELGCEPCYHISREANNVTHDLALKATFVADC